VTFAGAPSAGAANAIAATMPASTPGIADVFT
jgi:hypothetical protein